MQLRGGDLQRVFPDTAASEGVLLAEEDQDRRPQGAYEIADVDHDPVAQQGQRADLAAGPGHHDQVVAGEQFGARHHHQDQPDAEGQPDQQAGHAVGQDG